MTLALGLGRGRPRPAAIVAFSGFIPDVEGWELDADAPFPPIAIGHGTYDPIISVEFARRARERLEAAGADVTLPRVADAARDRPAGRRRAPALAARRGGLAFRRRNASQRLGERRELVA